MTGGGPKPAATEDKLKVEPNKTFFASIVRGEAKVEKVYEDDYCIAFDDIEPQAPIHTIIIPKLVVGGVGDIDNVDINKYKETMGHIMATIPKIASIKGANSYRLVINQGAQAGQSIHYLHVHLIGGRTMNWPPG